MPFFVFYPPLTAFFEMLDLKKRTFIVSGSQQQLKVVGDQSPCEACGLTFGDNRGQAVRKALHIRPVRKNTPPLDALHHDYDEGPRAHQFLAFGA
jgi:hypothetical protein